MRDHLVFINSTEPKTATSAGHCTIEQSCKATRWTVPDAKCPVTALHMPDLNLPCRAAVDEATVTLRTNRQHEHETLMKSRPKDLS
jgi:hypothetical protein